MMSVAALALVLAHIARYGMGREADEGTSAHLFQLLMILQVPIIGWFALRWLRREPGRGIAVLAVQFISAAAAFSAVYIMEHWT